MADNNNFSLTVIVIVFAIIAIFVGYFLGNWMIRVAFEGPAQNKEISDKKESEKKKTKEVEIDEEKTVTNVNKQSQEKETGSFSSDGYAVQAGAFNNYDNALSLKKELENKGYKVVITENKPHKVRLGPSSEKKAAEDIKKEIEKMGYNGFVINLNN